MEVTGITLSPSLQRKPGEVSEVSYELVHEQTLNPQYFKLLSFVFIIKKKKKRGIVKMNIGWGMTW